jgi:hypothetical protein
MKNNKSPGSDGYSVEFKKKQLGGSEKKYIIIN